MKTHVSFFFFLFASLLLPLTPVQAQDDIHMQKIRKAIEMMDHTLVDESIRLLDEVLKEDPDHYIARYERCYAYGLKGDHLQVVKTLEKLKKHPDADALLYQMLGNSYDELGKTKKAIKTYKAGLKKFPHAGNLYTELGTVAHNNGKYEQAFGYYEEGIRRAPKFSSNYYRAASLLFNYSYEKVWGLLYGELFMNLERNSERTEKMGKLLYDCYKENIRPAPEGNPDTVRSRSLKVTFSKEQTIRFDGKNIVLPFTQVYETTVALSFPPDSDRVDPGTLYQMRSRFLDIYYDRKQNEAYPNVLFDYQQKIRAAGHFEAYTYWLLGPGDEEAFENWYETHRTTWDEFIEWYQAHPIELDDNHRFCRTQYDE